MTYKEARVYLDKVSKYGSVLGLDAIRELSQGSTEAGVRMSESARLRHKNH